MGNIFTTITIGHYLLAVIIILLLLFFVIKKTRKKKLVEEPNHFNPLKEFNSTNTKTQVIKNSGLTVFQNSNVYGELYKAQNMKLIHTLLLECEYLIGRGKHCNIRMENDVTISREQCIIFYENGFYIKNISTSNQTLLNDLVVSYPIELNDGDRIKIGKVELLFKVKM